MRIGAVPEATTNFIRNVECSVACSKALDNSATSAKRTQVHVLSTRIELLDVADIGAQIDMLVQPSIHRHQPAILIISGSTATFEPGCT